MIIKKMAQKIGEWINFRKARSASKTVEAHYLTYLGELRARGYSIDATSLKFDGVYLTYEINASKKEKPQAKK